VLIILYKETRLLPYNAANDLDPSTRMKISSDYALGRGNRVDLLILKGLRALRFITFDMVCNHNTI
jgi:hypothetical protein